MALNRAFGRIVGRLPVSVGLLPRVVPLIVGAVLVLVLFQSMTSLTGDLASPEWPGPPVTPMSYLPLVSGALATALALAALRPRSGPALTTGATVGASLGIAAVSVLLWPLPKGVFGFGFVAAEMAPLLVLLTLTALRARPWQVTAAAGTAFAGALSEYLREPFFWSGYTMTSLSFVVVGLAPGLYLRWWEARRRTHVERARAQERLAIARDLHDVVAHEVTGIVVQVQALRHVADRNPGAVRDALPEIEAAGTRALESMRTMVARLREPGEAPLAPSAEEGLAALAAPAATGRPEVRVSVDGQVADLPTDVATTVLRVAQESVTNALRYARGAALVGVEVAVAADAVRMRIHDDGRGGVPPMGGGHGLVGMAERVRLLGGELTAGPTAPGHRHGWAVRARLPLTAATVPAAGAATRDDRNEDT
ncbi:signal transduction histidine kinase [Nocardiopsis sp. Huas11]|uniref:sensor histidine kinase n=1 Tax=Nocardiopsis sp. Huas11 TaxID=2183912 RepID=UPI000EB19097|nr:histidine kinase [Nocardiopsis sp. Huas11]RKS07271.1 signal transduction histidine kinase [Nocardiopsis sp. Huas11]